MGKFYKNDLQYLQAQRCHTCYGFSNWRGNHAYFVYEDRDCANCQANPDNFPEFAVKYDRFADDKEHDGLTR